MILLEPICVYEPHAKRGFEHVRQMLRKDILRTGVRPDDFKLLEDVTTLELFVLFRNVSAAASWRARTKEFSANEIWRAGAAAENLAPSNSP